MTDERIEQLVFNGVNGLTGTYGLSPVTSEELAAHILPAPGGAAEELKVLERQLQRDNAQKIAAIVDLLAESSFEDAERDEAWQEAWLGRLAELLATRLLEGDYTRPEQVKRLADRLRRDPKGKVVAVVTLLAENKAQDLAKLLLVDADEAPDNTSELKGRLKLDTLIRLGEVRNNLLTRSRAEELDGDLAAQRNWLEALLTALHLVPIQALNSLKEVRKLRPLEPLTKELDALANTIAQPSPWLEGFRQELGTLPRTMSWNKLVEVLRRGLEARIDAQADPLRWTDLLDALRRWLSALDEPVRQLGVIEGVDPNDLSQAGWGIIFPHEDPQRSSRFAAIEKQLEPLLKLRESQAGNHFQAYKEGRGYRPGDTASQFLARYGARPSDPADPAKVPYYLLLVGSPDEIPFPFQQQLDVQYAVGRIDFDDDLEAYARYARSVVAAEQDGITLAPRVAFFAPANPGDTMTKNSVEKLVEPLYERLKRVYGAQWQIDTALRGGAKKTRLRRLLGGKDTPALLFAACHGIEFPKDDARGRQARDQGALICQEWRGPGAEPGEVRPGYYFSADDLAGGANLLGLIAFFFACYGAGTPRFDEYSKQAFKERGETITDHPFVAALPKAMLSLSKGGALAVVGHVERAWGTSFMGPRNSEQIAVFQSAVERLLKGYPVGAAMEYMNGRYAAVSTELTAAIENIESFGLPANPYELAELWTANNDARGYIVIGDPAVRLPVAQTAASATGRRDLDGG